MLRRLDAVTAAALRLIMPEFEDRGDGTYDIPVYQTPRMGVQPEVVLQEGVAETYSLYDPAEKVMGRAFSGPIDVAGDEDLIAYCRMRARGWTCSPPLGCGELAAGRLSIQTKLTAAQVLALKDSWFRNVSLLAAQQLNESYVIRYISPVLTFGSFSDVASQSVREYWKA